MGVYIPFTPRLPSTYQEVEYIESSGTQRIDTGLKPTDATFGFKGKVNMSALSGDRMIIGITGVLDSSGSAHNKFGMGGYNNYWQICNIMTYTSGWTNVGTVSTGVDYEFSYNYNSDRKFTVNGSNVKTGLTADGYTYSKNWSLFCETIDVNQYTSETYYRYSSCKLYYFQIYQGTTLVRDFIPCYRKSDNVIGLYDLTNNQFYTNAGTGTFSKGADVTAVPLKNAYIGEVYEYSYDFRNKTQAQITADGWEIKAGSVSFSSDGMRLMGYPCRIKKSGISDVMRSAKKITQTFSFLCQGYAIRYAIAQDVTSSSAPNVTGTYLDSRTGTRRVEVGGVYQDASGFSAGTYTATVVVDLENKTASLSIPSYADVTKTLTDADVTNVRNNTNCIYLYGYQHDSDSSKVLRISTLSLIIE